MKTVVITGGTRGIGLGMAHEFLVRGCNVVISGRSDSSVQRALESLRAAHPAERMSGQVCEVGDSAQLQALWDGAVQRFGRVDIWINNAANNTPVQKLVWEQPIDAIDSVIRTNMLGVIYGSKVAIAGMLAQGGGHLYNMEGFGSQGEVNVGNAMYGTTKAGLRYLTTCLIAETKNTPVKVSYLSPGMVATDLLVQTIAPGRETQAEKIFNILADKVETVTPWLVEQILANDKHGNRIAWLNKAQIMMRFMTSPFRKRDVMGDMIRSKT